ncbi:hypothetical protein Tco_0242690 [Tanacetum coccineum]
MIPHNNAFSGTNGKDTVEHIEYYLKIIDPIKLSNVDHGKLRVVVFPISLAGGARRWFDKTKESITCWVDLTAKFFGKYYPPSRIEGNKTPVIKWDPANPRFEGWLATKFVNYKTKKRSITKELCEITEIEILKWYEALKDSELKDEALRNKAIMKGLISDDESSDDYWKRWKSHEIYYHNYDEREYENETHKQT